MPIPYVTSAQAGWEPRPAEPEQAAPRSANRLRAVARRRSRRHPRRLRHLPQPVGLQRPDGVRAQPAVLLHPAGRCSGGRARPASSNAANILTSDPTGVVAPNIMDHDYAVEYTQTWSGGLQYELLPATMVEVSYMGSWTLGADNATVRNVPEPGPGSIQARRPIPQLGPIRSIRFDGQSIYHGVTFKAEQRLRNNYVVQRQLHALDVERRCLESRTDRRGNELPAERPEHLRRDGRVGAFELRPPAPVRRQRHVPAAVLRAAREGSQKRLLGGWRVNAVFSAQSGAPFTVNLGVDQANIGAGPAQRPDQLRDPNLPAADRTPERWFDTSAFALQAPFTFGSAPRNSVHRPRLSRTWIWRSRRRGPSRGTPAARVPVGGLQRAQHGELRSAEPDLRHAEFRPHLQREESARDAVRREDQLLDAQRQAASAGWVARVSGRRHAVVKYRFPS